MELNGYKNKYFSVLGDSISTFGGASEPEDAVFYDTSRKLESEVLTMGDTWWGRAIEGLGGRLLVNNSFSGSTVCYHKSFEIPSYACSDERTSSLGKDGISPDVIMVYMGTNDWGWGFRVFRDERYDPAKDDPRRFESAYGQMLGKLRENYPEAELWCFTLAVSKCVRTPEFSFPYYYGGRHISEYCKAIRGCAEAQGCRVIDLYERAEPYDTIDGFHPNAYGMKTIAEAVMESLKE